MIKIYKTFEISDELWQQIADGFNESFEGHSATVDSLKNGFCIRNQWGYAFHAVAFDDATGEVMGFNTDTPNLYKNDIKVFVSGSSFVRKKYRKDIFIYFDMMRALKKRGIEEGIHIGLGVPNHNSLNYGLKFLGANLVGYLDYYMLPRNISKCLHKSWLSPIDWLTRCFSNVYIGFEYMLSKVVNPSEMRAKYSLVTDDNYLKARFADSCYARFEDNKITAYYRIFNENEARVAYIMDFREKGKRTARALIKTVRYIKNTEKPDAILFVGFLRLRQHILLKVPSKFIPKPLPLTYSVYNPSDNDRFKDMKDIKNWDFSLMNFDVR